MYKIDFYIKMSTGERVSFRIGFTGDDIGKFIQTFIDGRDGFEIINITVYPL